LKRLKKGQSEIAGFVIIVLIVVLIGLVLLALMLRPSPRNQTRAEVSNILQASMYHTTDCYSFQPQYYDVLELIEKCYDKVKCYDGRDSCVVLNKTYSEVLKKVLIVGEDSQYKGYKLAIFRNGSLEREEILRIFEGNNKNCSARFGGSRSVATSEMSGYIDIQLELCRN